MFTDHMNLLDLTANQLKRAAAIKEQIDKLNKELARILGARANSETPAKNQRTMSASARRKIAAAQKARWAKIRDAKPATLSARSARKAKKKRMGRTSRAKLAMKTKV